MHKNYKKTDNLANNGIWVKVQIIQRELGDF